MKNIFFILLLAVSHSTFAQSNAHVSVFHRLIIYNDDKEMMLVKIKDTDIWVTPGFYQDSTIFIKQGLIDIAGTYGITISDPELKGTFAMRREKGEITEMLLRNIYHCKYLSGNAHFPANQPFEIGEIRWLPMKEASSLIPFESMVMFVKQTDDYPNQVSGGSIHAVKENDQWKYEIIEEFYPLFSSKKGKKKRKK